MNDFGMRLGGIAQNVSRQYALGAPDDAAELIRRARRGRVLWTGAVGTVGLASAAAIALGGSAAASGTFGMNATPAHHDTGDETATELVAPVKAHAAKDADPAVATVKVTADKPEPVKAADKHKATAAKHSAAKKAQKSAAKDGSCAGMKSDAKAGHHHGKRHGTWGGKDAGQK